jgi:hypothetical protein
MADEQGAIPEARARAKVVRNRVMIASVMAGEQDQLGASWAEEVGIRAMLVYAKEAAPTDTGALSSTAVADGLTDTGEGEARKLIADLLWVIDRSHGHRHVEAAERARAYLSAPASKLECTEHDAYRLRLVAEADCGCRIPAPFDQVADHLAVIAFDEGAKRCTHKTADAGAMRERCARVARDWYPGEEMAGCGATWADAKHAIEDLIRNLPDAGELL